MTFGVGNISLTINFLGDGRFPGYPVEHKTLADYDLADGEVVGNKATMNQQYRDSVS